jgi:hypothetical protein
MIGIFLILFDSAASEGGRWEMGRLGWTRNVERCEMVD